MTDLFDAPGQSGGANEIRRDRWGRPMIVPPGGSKAVAYTRVTTLVGAAEDTYNLSRWSQRNVAFGMARRDDLILAAASCELSDKSKLNEIVDRAAEAANAKGSATKGTALHTIAERVDLGEPLGHVPEAYRADVEAYRKATEELNYAAVEQFRVCDTYRIAGTTDRIVDMGDRYIIADIKTGSVDYGGGKIAGQLAAYANAVPYDVKANRRLTDDKPVDKTVGLVIHLPVGTGTCQLHWVDLVRGWETVELCSRIMKWRKEKDWLTPVNPGEVLVSSRPPADPAELAHAARRVAARPTPETLVAQALSFDDIGALRNWYSALDFRGESTPEVLAACQRRAIELT